ncbi:hypothetical protein K875_05465 [Mycobacterium [tuberculosis] TKK-01-0051]|uniref:Uncharacterized protein n=1 Tax=Mycobacterium [tuberculosis] TKK-01-0051 TaxID=1324261 RepID=A0A051TJJ4_9MYCO|nr:hypothetical protein K875_05465 [Mycobacterium [tuberculosis] TKK-01-0051]
MPAANFRNMSRGGGIRTHGLFVPNERDLRIWVLAV